MLSCWLHAAAILSLSHSTLHPRSGLSSSQLPSETDFSPGLNPPCDAYSSSSQLLTLFILLVHLSFRVPACRCRRSACSCALRCRPAMSTEEPSRHQPTRQSRVSLEGVNTWEQYEAFRMIEEEQKKQARALKRAEARKEREKERQQEDGEGNEEGEASKDSKEKQKRGRKPKKAKKGKSETVEEQQDGEQDEEAEDDDEDEEDDSTRAVALIVIDDADDKPHNNNSSSSTNTALSSASTGKKRGRPTKAEVEAKRKEAERKGEVYQTPAEKRRAQQDATTPDNNTPASAHSTPKKRATKPKSTPPRPPPQLQHPTSAAAGGSGGGAVLDKDEMYGELYRLIGALPNFVSVTNFMQRAAVLAKARIQVLEEEEKEGDANGVDDDEER